MIGISNPGLLLATDACNAMMRGRCDLCPRPVEAGERVARLLTGQWAHLPCLAAMIPPADGRTRL